MVAGAIGSDCLFHGPVGGFIDYAEAVSWTITTHPRDRRPAVLQSGRGVRCRKTDARFGGLVWIRRVQHQRVVQTHLTSLHHYVMRRIDRHLRRRALRRQVVWVREIRVRHEAESMRTRHDAQAAVLFSRRRKTKPDRRHVRIFDLLGKPVLMPADERVARGKLVEHSSRLQHDVWTNELFHAIEDARMSAERPGPTKIKMWSIEPGNATTERRACLFDFSAKMAHLGVAENGNRIEKPKLSVRGNLLASQRRHDILKILSILFTKTVCINLDRRPDRWRRIQAELARHGFASVERFPAIDGNLVERPTHWTHTAGAYGCLLSHVQVVSEARNSGAPNVLIFEDDAVLDSEFETKYARFIKEVPDDWDMLYFGALHKDEPAKISEHVARIIKANSTYAYALKRTVFDEFIALNARAENVLDMNSYLLQQRFNCYCLMPNLAWVEAEYSDVQNRLEHHWYLEKSLVLFGAEMDRLLSRTTILIEESTNAEFLKRCYEEYFAPLAEIVVVDDLIARAESQRNFIILSPRDIYLEALDVRANLRMCETFDAATGFDEVIDLTRDQALLLRRTAMTRGIDVTKNTVSKNTEIHFLKRGGRTERIFQSPNHALRLPRD